MVGSTEPTENPTSDADVTATAPPGRGVDRAAGAGVLIAARVSALVVNANTSAVTILLPAISDDVGTSLDVLQWAVTGYMLVGAAVIVTSGALGDVLGRRRVFLAGLRPVRPLLRADRAIRQRSRRDRRPHDPGRGRLDPARLRDEHGAGDGRGGRMRLTAGAGPDRSASSL